MTRWELPTATTTYTVVATELGLELAHWGRPVRVVPPRGTFETAADIAPLELVAAIPTAIVFFAFQKQFVSGLLVGSNK